MSDIEKRARELLPCPFCGYRAEGTRAHSTVAQRVAGYDLLQFGVRCADLGCECELRGFSTRDEADEAWNTRAALTPPDGNPWQKAIDQQRVLAHIGIAADGVSDEQAERQLAELIDWHVKVATDPAVNGGFVLVPVEPTEAMCAEGERAGDGHDWAGPAEVWDAMLRSSQNWPVWADEELEETLRYADELHSSLSFEDSKDA